MSPIKQQSPISRRGFLKLAALTASGAAGLASTPWFPDWGSSALAARSSLAEFPQADRLGRVCVGKIDLKARPDQDSPNVGVLYEDAVVVWEKEVVGRRPYYINQRWVETPEGYIYGPYVVPVGNHPSTPVTDLFPTSLGSQSGMWAEVTVPYVDIILERTPSSDSWVDALIEEGRAVRVYYQQVFYVDNIKTTDQGQVLYHINPNYYGGVDMFWVPAEAMRPIQPEEVVPISPDVTDKRVVVDVIHQTLACYEGNSEVFFCRVSTGAKFDAYGNAVDKWSTPLGKLRATRKYLSLQMSGGTTGASYDLPGIGWSTIFANGGVAIHSTFWHNDFGVPRSHGCVNASPDHARWIFRWTQPTVQYGVGLNDITVTGDAGTTVEVIEG